VAGGKLDLIIRGVATSLRATAIVARLGFPLEFPLVHGCQLRVITRRQFGGLDQDRLQMPVALLGDRPPLFFVGRTVLRAGQPVLAERLRNRRIPR
jgi:hypothetical protein